MNTVIYVFAWTIGVSMLAILLLDLVSGRDIEWLRERLHARREERAMTRPIRDRVQRIRRERRRR